MKKITIALIMVISLIAPIQTMAESVTQNGTIIGRRYSGNPYSFGTEY